MDKTQIITKIYGYLVCLVAVIVTLIAVGQIVNASFALSDPIHTRDYSYASAPYDISSFESYKADYNRFNTFDKNSVSAASVSTLTDDQLKAAYNSARENQISTVRLQATKTITTYLILLVVAGLLFLGHWRWLHKEK